MAAASAGQVGAALGQYDACCRVLRKELGKRGYVPSAINLGANTDPYQPIERNERLTRGVIEVLSRFEHPFSIITKSALIARDLDLMAPMAAKAKLLTEVDVQAFAMGCVAIAQYRLASQRTGQDAVKRKLAEDKDGNNFSDGDGNPVYAGEHINPWVLIQSMTFKQAMAVFDKFGMTPQARTRIALQPQGDLFGGDKAGSAGYFS